MDYFLVELHQVVDRERPQELMLNLFRLQFVAQQHLGYLSSAQARLLAQFLLVLLLKLQIRYRE
jgi:hypothetical protein